MLHSIGCAQPRASVFLNSWNKETYSNACVHGFIDANDGTVYQTLPWNFRGWHGGGSSNNTHIGIEMCEPACIKYTSGAKFTCSDVATAQAAVKRTYDAAVELFAMLCKQYKLDPLTAICSHKEGCAKGIASNHGDPEHLWSQLNTGYTMDTFRAAVKAKMGSVSVQQTSPAVKKSAFTPYLVKVTASVLNVRTGPGKKHPVAMQIKNGGAYTIVEENGDWGKLKSGAGWICLSYTEKM